MFICVHLWIDSFLGASAGRGLAAWAEMAAPTCHDGTADDCLAAKTWLSISLIDAVAELEFASLAFGVKVVGN